MSSFGYVGWSGRGNLGDDAIFEAVRSRLVPADLVEVPLYPKEIGTFLARGARAELRTARPLLGGGTVIGRMNWRVHLRTALLLARRRPAVMIGAGVEDPTFSGRHSFGSERELRRWRRVLEEFDRVTVRGPHSQELLAQAGIPSEVVGDPALLLEPARAVDPDDRTIGVALGFGDDLWGHSQDAVVQAVGAAVRELVGRGWRVHFFVVNAEDREHAVSCARLAGLDPSRTAFLPAAEPEVFLDQVGRCTVVVGQRLHAVVLAAGAFVPAVMVEYQPKCRDFMASIGRTDWLVRTDRITKTDILERVVAAAETRGAQAAQIELAVNELRCRLERELAHVRSIAGMKPGVAARRDDASRGVGGR
jgi:Uncharacterized conserved protein